MDDPQQIFDEIDTHLLNDDAPSAFLESLKDNRIFMEQEPFVRLSGLRRVKQSPEYHPEGNVWRHTLMVTDLAARCREKSTWSRPFLWAALLHDTGKAETTRLKKGRLVSYDHDKAGERITREFLSAFSTDPAFIDRAALLTRWHMQALYFSKGGGRGNAAKLLSDVPLRDIALLTLCDRLGRGKTTKEKSEEETARVRDFVKSLDPSADTGFLSVGT